MKALGEGGGVCVHLRQKASHHLLCSFERFELVDIGFMYLIAREIK